MRHQETTILAIALFALAGAASAQPQLSVTPPTEARRDGETGAQGRVYSGAWPPGANINCGGGHQACRKRFPRNATVTLKTERRDGLFVAWSDACRGTHPTCTLTLPNSGNVNAVAFFARPTINVVYAPLDITEAGRRLGTRPLEAAVEMLTGAADALGV